MSVVDIVVAALLFTGALFMFVASVGVLRMPDLFLRMSASTKAATLGSGAMLLGVAAHFGDIGVTTRALATIVFLLLTAPVAAHMLSRAGYFVGVELCEDTIVDELQGHYNLRTHALDSCEPIHTLKRRTPVTPPETPEPSQ